MYYQVPRAFHCLTPNPVRRVQRITSRLDGSMEDIACQQQSSLSRTCTYFFVLTCTSYRMVQGFIKVVVNSNQNLPLTTYRYIPTIEWIIIYSHVPLTFHIITNTDSKPYVEKVTAKNVSK